HQRLEVFVGGIVTNDGHAIVATDGGQPADVVDVVAAELALGQVQQRAAGEGHDGVGVCRALSDDVVVSHRTNATGHVNGAHRFLHDVGAGETVQSDTPGEVETTAGLSRCNALGLAGLLCLDCSHAGERHQA